MVAFRPSPPSAAVAAEFLGGFNFAYTQEGRPCVYPWVDDSPNNELQTIAVTATDEAGRTWSVSSDTGRIGGWGNALVLPRNSCVRVEAEATVRRGDKLETWRAEGPSRGCAAPNPADGPSQGQS